MNICGIKLLCPGGKYRRDVVDGCKVVMFDDECIDQVKLWEFRDRKRSWQHDINAI